MEPVAPATRPRSFLEERGISPVLFGIVCLLGIFALYQLGGGVLTYLSLGELAVTEPLGEEADELVAVLQSADAGIPTPRRLASSPAARTSSSRARPPARPAA